LNLRPLGFLGLALVLQLLLLEKAGFVIACTVQFVLAARAFHSRRPVRDLMIGFILCVSVYVAFSMGLGLPLPLGVFERAF
jgi:putative tricarboxylic transport membrane protein